jgi:hypothetical protein
VSRLTPALLVTLAATLVTSAAAAAPAAEEAQPSWGLYFKSGPYKPQMGSGTVHDYYELIYSSQKDSSLFKNRPLMSEVVVTWYVVNQFGLLGPTAHLGLWGVAGPTRVCGTDRCTASTVFTSTPGNDTTRLSIFPLGVGLEYRLDLLKRYTGVPLVPYASASLDYYFWRNSVGGKVSSFTDTATGTHRRGVGGTAGYRATGGVAFNLDVIEPDAASRAHATTGMTDSYLFLEYTRIWADGFGDAKRLDFSGTMIQLGVGVEFQ